MARNIVRLPGLRGRGIPYTRPHLRRLEASTEFPKRIPLGPNSIGWVEDEIDAWVEARIAARDGRLDDFMADRKAARGSLEDWLINTAKKFGWRPAAVGVVAAEAAA